MGEKMKLKKLGSVIIEFISHPMHIIVFIWVAVELHKKLHEEYLKETALERMIYSKR